MAGIGFELQRVLKKGGLTGAFKAALAGIIIVAGPWLISIIGISFLYHFSSSSLNSGGMYFTAVVVYSYAFSLFIFGGFHYVFTRYIADLIYIKDDSRAFASLLLSLGLTAFFSGIIASFAMYYLDTGDMAYPVLFKLSAVGLFMTINMIWLVMIFITLLKRYVTITLIYIFGMGLSVFAAYFLRHRYYLSGTLAGFFSGQLFILAALVILIVFSIKPSSPLAEAASFIKYFGKYKFLLLTGMFYSFGIWIDKIMLWFLKGESIGGSFFHLFAAYDLPVYLANLTIIPGLVYFMIFSESNFYVTLRRALLHLNSSNLCGINRDKKVLLRTMRTSMTEQALFQGVITVSLILVAPEIKDIFLGPVPSVTTLRITFGALFFNLMLLTSVTFLFYLEKYKESFISVFLFFSVNFGVTLYNVISGSDFYGYGYLAACASGTFAAVSFMIYGIMYFDRDIFSKL